jgi:hypothetical protein
MALSTILVPNVFNNLGNLLFAKLQAVKTNQKEMLDVTRIEPVTPCLQSTKPASNEPLNREDIRDFMTQNPKTRQSEG